MGPQTVGVLASGVPRRFRFLPGSNHVQQTFPKECDILIAVDVSAPDRVGYNLESLPREVDINIDHHPTNTHFGKINLVQPEAAATTEILYDLSKPLGWTIDVDVAINLLTGLVTDTIGFRTTNVTPKVLRTAAELIELGAPLAEIYERSLNTRSFDAARYWGRGLSQLQREDGLIWASLTSEDRAQVGYPGFDDADLINLLTTIEGAQVTIIFIEQPGDMIKVSWRSRSGIDVATLATSFGGGGHKQAAGAMVSGQLSEVQSKVLTATQALIRSITEKDE
jgi:phosphoesterase RecJ-like protein